MSEEQNRPQLEYRAYYNEHGAIITYTTERLPGNYIIVEREQYAEARHDARVIEGHLVYTHVKNQVFKLYRKIDGKYRVNKWDVSVVAEGDDVDWVTYGLYAYNKKS